MAKLSSNALAVYKKLYLSKILDEQIPTEVHHRVAKFAAGDNLELERRFFELMDENRFRPNTPVMMNAGIHPNPQTSACFVGDLRDNMESILDFDREAATIYKSGSGIGGNYGLLREINAPLSTGGASSGPFAFLRKLAMTAHAVKSGGSSRRAAHMAMFTDTHPNLLDFIELKAKSDEFVILPSGEKSPLFSAMNLSIAISDAFMKAASFDSNWNLLKVASGEIASTHIAREIFDKIARNAWTNGDPGVWFVDRANKDNTVPSLGRIMSTNPCGEQHLLPRQSCALGAINIAAYVQSDESFDKITFKRDVGIATEFLDNCIDLSGYPTPKYKEMALQTRPIGLGIMGFADALILMGIKYGSDDSITFARELSHLLTSSSIAKSIELASLKGSFPIFDVPENKEAVKLAFAKYHISSKHMKMFGETGIRNSQWTTIAPTGSTSISCDCSQGMEPLFAICYDKHISDSDEIWTFVNPIFEKRFKNNCGYERMIEDISANHGSIAGLDLPDEAKIFVSAHDIHWQERIEIQAALQKYISNAISSTINLPQTAVVEEIKNIYMTAWKSGLKGITVFRDGCLKDQPVNFGKTKTTTVSELATKIPKPTVVNEPVPIRPRNKIRNGHTYEVKTGHGKIYLTINCDENNQPMEIFTNGGKNGSVNSANLEALARLISIALQEGVSVERLTKTIENINDGTTAWDKLSETDKRAVCISSVPDAMGKILRRFYCQNKNSPQLDQSTKTDRRCSECNSPLFLHDGCDFCPECGSKCG